MADHRRGGGAQARNEWRAPMRYAPAASRAGLAALFRLDATLGRLVRTTSQPMLGQMRLAWWREALARLDTAPPPAEPVLAALAADVLPRGVSGATLAGLVDGWEALFAEALDAAALATFATARGGGLFAAGAALLGAGDPAVMAAGEGWALADLAMHVTSDAVAQAARTAAEERLELAFHHPWPRRLRPLGILALAARADLAGRSPRSPSRAARAFFHRLTGR